MVVPCLIYILHKTLCSFQKFGVNDHKLRGNTSALTGLQFIVEMDLFLQPKFIMYKTIINARCD
jgi:hypothetical protein